MKKIILTFSILFFAISSKADQLSYITKNQADSAVVFLKTQSKVLLWCACCDKDPKNIIKVTKVYSEFTNYKNFYQVILEGIDTKGKTVKMGIDFAYTHVLREGTWHCAGVELGFKCDPCTKPFK